MYLSVSPCNGQGSLTEAHWLWERPATEKGVLLCEPGSQQRDGYFLPASEQVLQLPVPQFPPR